MKLPGCWPISSAGRSGGACACCCFFVFLRVEREAFLSVVVVLCRCLLRGFVCALSLSLSLCVWKRRAASRDAVGQRAAVACLSLSHDWGEALFVCAFKGVARRRRARRVFSLSHLLALLGVHLLQVRLKVKLKVLVVRHGGGRSLVLLLLLGRSPAVSCRSPVVNETARGRAPRPEAESPGLPLALSRRIGREERRREAGGVYASADGKGRTGVFRRRMDGWRVWWSG